MNHSKIRFLRDGSMLRWVDYGPFRFNFRRWQCHVDDYLPVVSISATGSNGDRWSGRFIEQPGGWHLIGFDMGCAVPPISFVPMNEWDRLEIVNSLS